MRTGNEQQQHGEMETLAPRRVGEKDSGQEARTRAHPGQLCPDRPGSPRADNFSFWWQTDGVLLPWDRKPHACSLDHWFFFFHFLSYNAKRSGNKSLLLFVIPKILKTALMSLLRIACPGWQGLTLELEDVLHVFVWALGSNWPSCYQSCSFMQPLFLEGPVCWRRKMMGPVLPLWT